MNDFGRLLEKRNSAAAALCSCLGQDVFDEGESAISVRAWVSAEPPGGARCRAG
jgi:hypothetical protein